MTSLTPNSMKFSEYVSEEISIISFSKRKIPGVLCLLKMVENIGKLYPSPTKVT